METTIEKATQKPHVERLIDEIKAARSAKTKARIRKSESIPNFYLSSQHTCTRSLYYQLTEGDKRPPFNEYVQDLVDSGRDQEKIVKRELLEMGFELTMADERVVIPYHGQVKELRGKTMATGRIDGLIRYEGKEIVCEIKSTGENMFKRLVDADSLLKFEHTERYMRQLLTYLYAKNQEEGFFLIVDGRGHWNLFPIYLGNFLAEAELSLKKMEAAFEAAKSPHIGAPPDRISYHSGICGKCQFNPICLPDQVIAGADSIDDPEVEASLARHEELRPAVAEYDDLHSTISDLFKGRPRTTVGMRFQVTCATQKRKKVDTKLLDPEVLKEITSETEITIVKIKDLLAPSGGI